MVRNKLPVSENSVRDAIVQLLQLHKYMVLRINVGAAPYTDRYGKKRWVQFGKKGFSDIFAIQPGTGVFVALETKSPTGKYGATPEQLEFIAQVKAHGGIAAVVNSPEAVAALLGIKGLL